MLIELWSNHILISIFTFKKNQDIKFTGKQGTSVTIPRYALSNAKGDIKISFREFTKKSDLILNNIPTNSVGNTWLETGGSFFLNIQDSTGKSLFFDTNILFEFPINTNIADISNMSVWAGDYESPNGTLRPFYRWINISSQDDSANVFIDSLGEGYIMSTPNFNWINCDHVFETTSELTKVKVSVSNKEVGMDDINTFLVLKNINSVLSLYKTNDIFESFPIPVGEEAYIVSLGINDGYFLNITPITITKNQEINVRLEQVDLKKLYDRIKSLDN